MIRFPVLLLLLTTAAFASDEFANSNDPSAPERGEYIEGDIEPYEGFDDSDDPSAPERGEHIEGDMIEPFEGAFSGLLNTNTRWPNGVIVYKFASSLSSTARTRTLEAIRRIPRETNNCIRFREANSNDGNRFVLIQGSNGCSATVGYWRRTTYVNLSPRCTVGNIMHEFQHSLGIYHHHSRPDRDDYVRIAYENIIDDYKFAFDKQPSTRVGTFGVSYDFGSMMHYPVHAFTKNGRDTIVPLPGKVPNGVRIGQRNGMSQGDVALVRRMYGC